MSRRVFAAAVLLVLSLPAAAGASAAAGGQSNAAGAAQALAAIARAMALSDAKRAQLQTEIKRLAADERSLSRALAAAEEKERALDKSLQAGAAKLAELERKHAAQSRLLAARRGEMAEILAALEQLSYNPPPAVLTERQDAAQALHASILLGAVLPQMQEKTAQTQTEADRLAALQAQITAEQDRLKPLQLRHKEEALKLELLLAEKAQRSRQQRRGIEEEEENRRNLAEKAQSLQDLFSAVSRGEGQSSAALLPAVKFSALRGQLTVPVEGRRLTAFGQMLGGKPAAGESFAAAAGAPVLAPAEGIVRYAGVFRSYGRVLILDAGENYYIILAGLGEIYAAAGRSVLQGEPVGVMESALPANKEGYSLGKAAPKLYIEIRKDGRPLNPALWWAGGGAPS